MKKQSSLLSIIATCTVLVTVAGWLTISSRPTNGSPQQESEAIVEKSFLNVFGRDPSADDLSHWLKTIRDEHIGYDTIVVRQMDWLVSNDGTRELEATITRSFQAAFGRDPNQKELQDWVKGVRERRIPYANIVNEHVNFLISEAGDQELTETIKRSFQAAFHNDPSDEELVAWKRGVKHDHIPYSQILLRHSEWLAGVRPENKSSGNAATGGGKGNQPAPGPPRLPRNLDPKQISDCPSNECFCYCPHRKQYYCTFKRAGTCIEACDRDLTCRP